MIFYLRNYRDHQNRINHYNQTIKLDHKCISFNQKQSEIFKKFKQRNSYNKNFIKLGSFKLNCKKNVKKMNTMIVGCFTKWSPMKSISSPLVSEMQDMKIDCFIIIHQQWARRLIKTSSNRMADFLFVSAAQNLVTITCNH